MAYSLLLSAIAGLALEISILQTLIDLMLKYKTFLKQVRHTSNPLFKMRSFWQPRSSMTDKELMEQLTPEFWVEYIGLCVYKGITLKFSNENHSNSSDICAA